MSISFRNRVFRRQAGVTLVELMVGMVLGMLAVLVITQVTALSESQKRTTTTGSDAQANGAIALHMLQRDLKSAGYGLASYAPALGCTLKATFQNATAITGVVTPVQITVGTSASNGNSDSLRIVYSTRLGYSTPTRVTDAHAQTATSFSVESHIGVQAGDVLMAVPPAWTGTQWCSLFQASAAGSANTISHAAGTGLSWNPADLTGLFPTGGYLIDSRVVNLGTLTARDYTINADGLLLATRTIGSGSTAGDLDGSASSVAAPNVVLMKAFYGVDTDGDGDIDQYNQTTPTTATGWQRVQSVRIAIVTRSDQKEREEVTATAPEWLVGNSVPVTGSAACSFDSSKRCLSLPVSYLGSSEWKFYRYRVFDTVVPLRNLLWSS